MTETTKAPKTWRDHLKALSGALLIVGSSLLLLEALLRLIDPWGLRYFDDLARMGNELFVYDEARGYLLQDGDHVFSHWRASIRQGERVVPNTNPEAACTLAVLGDSVAFGYGVDDEQAWVNLLAARFPQVHIINAAVPRYNSTNVLLSARDLEARGSVDAYFYLIIGNDTEGSIDVRTFRFVGDGGGLPQIVRYLNFALFRGVGTDYSPPPEGDTTTLGDSEVLRRLLNEMAELNTIPNMHFAAFQYEPLTNTLLAEGFNVALLRYPDRRISVADYHLDPQGNVELAENIEPLWEAILSQTCLNR
ncbi:MAG: hypothetical protein RML73_01060 [Anaerolineae bacterium]|nr:hypothetical protein [Anaerolineae bacterium]